MTLSYDEFFHDTTSFAPYPYQKRLGEEPFPQVLDVPTGLGKTAAAAVAWMYKRLREPAQTPRRLVYCLPMRSLVDQTYDALTDWTENAASHFENRDRSRIHAYKLMGGEQQTEWAENPEQPAAIVGTQDMLVSRALMRGYGMSRFEWPVHFALLHNDAFWVFDETQLMGVSVETSAQLQAFREEFGTAAPSDSMWMSATVAGEQLDTVDHPEPNDDWEALSLSEEDLDREEVERRWTAEKPVELADSKIPNSTSTRKRRSYAEDLADEIAAAHDRHDGLTLVVVNRVDRAQELYETLENLDGGHEPLLLHSRFREHERGDLEEELERANNQQQHRVVVATQVVEAGLDISSNTMVTELAPWPSIVQRVGRCNRDGTVDNARVIVADAEEGEKAASPYSTNRLARARDILESIDDLGPASLDTVEFEPDTEFHHVLRRRDFRELFDTTPDLSGNTLDVKRFVRDTDDNDVLVVWRDWEETGVPPDEMSAPQREEICRVPCWGDQGIRKFLDQNSVTGWSWDPLADTWLEVEEPTPGDTVVLDVSDGGYTLECGWTGTEERPGEPVHHLATDGEPEESYDGDDVDVGDWVELADHLERVAGQAERVVESVAAMTRLDLNVTPEVIVTAAAWHDVGKAHWAFQEMLMEPTERENGPEPPSDKDALYAKSNHRSGKPGRKYFRHELASALAWLQTPTQFDGQGRDLVAYLIGAHHGKVRQSIRSLPAEEAPEEEPDRLVARGVHDGDELPEVEVPGHGTVGPVVLDLEPMTLGHRSWLDRMLELRDHDDIGPFRLAYLESLVRIADWRASEIEKQKDL